MIPHGLPPQQLAGRPGPRSCSSPECWRPHHLKENTKMAERYRTPWKINMEHNHRGLEDHFPVSMGDLYVPC